MSWERACRELHQGAGTHFDPTVIDALTVCEPDLFATHASVLASTSS
jgi:response regulator RpfG family c-di-GMP phosphodiesterase